MTEIDVYPQTVALTGFATTGPEDESLKPLTVRHMGVNPLTAPMEVMPSEIWGGGCINTNLWSSMRKG